jgi:hypothetical protein
MPTPVALDHLLLLLFAIVSPLVDKLWLYPRLSREIAAGVPGARSRFYLTGMVFAWGLTAVVLAHWAAQRRPISSAPPSWASSSRSSCSPRARSGRRSSSMRSWTWWPAISATTRGKELRRTR